MHPFFIKSIFKSSEIAVAYRDKSIDLKNKSRYQVVDK